MAWHDLDRDRQHTSTASTSAYAWSNRPQHAEAQLHPRLTQRLRLRQYQLRRLLLLIRRVFVFAQDALNQKPQFGTHTVYVAQFSSNCAMARRGSDPKPQMKALQTLVRPVKMSRCPRTSVTVLWALVSPR